MNELIIAFGLFLFIEGVLYALIPSKMKNMLKKIDTISDTQLRTAGLIFSIIGFSRENSGWMRADKRGLKRTEGHTAGEKSLFDVVEGAIEIGVEWFTVFAFSTENWKRPAKEVQFLLDFNEQIIIQRQDELNERNVRICFLGRRDGKVPKRIVKRMEEAEKLTKSNTGLTFTVAFNYGGRAEIVDAVQKVIDSGVKKVTEKTIEKNLYNPEMPDPDLVIRTSGESRVSNFLLWELAYSELVFSDTLWPDFSRKDLFNAIKEFQDRDRRFGGLGGS